MIVTNHYLYCDRCWTIQTADTSDMSKTQVLREGREAGWKRVLGRDICDECQKETP